MSACGSKRVRCRALQCRSVGVSSSVGAVSGQCRGSVWTVTQCRGSVGAVSGQCRDSDTVSGQCRGSVGAVSVDTGVSECRAEEQCRSSVTAAGRRRAGRRQRTASWALPLAGEPSRAPSRAIRRLPRCAAPSTILLSIDWHTRSVRPCLAAAHRRRPSRAAALSLRR
jgi:hypothetical protein